MVHHSDGEDVADKGTIEYDEKGNVVCISIPVNSYKSVGTYYIYISKIRKNCCCI